MHTEFGKFKAIEERKYIDIFYSNSYFIFGENKSKC